VWVHKPLRVHEVVRFVKRHPRICRKNKCYADRASTADTGPTVHQNLSIQSVHRLEPFDRLRYQVALDRIVCTVAHCDLAVNDRCRTMLVVVMGFGGRSVDHVQIVGDVQHVREAKLGGVCCRDEISKMNAAKDVIIVWTLLRAQQHQLYSEY